MSSRFCGDKLHNFCFNATFSALLRISSQDDEVDGDDVEGAGDDGDDGVGDDDDDDDQAEAGEEVGEEKARGELKVGQDWRGGRFLRIRR